MPAGAQSESLVWQVQARHQSYVTDVREGGGGDPDDPLLPRFFRLDIS
jgi:hypothetical protein